MFFYEFLLLLMLSVLIIAVALQIFRSIDDEYRTFVLDHSVALKQLKAINQRYTFYTIPKFNMTESYDNVNFYEDISERDFLIYQLISVQNPVKRAITDTAANRILYEKYLAEITQIDTKGKYDAECFLKNEERLLNIECQLFENEKKRVTLFFSISVTLRLTNIHGNYKTSKQRLFSEDEILTLIDCINQKKGHFYLNQQIWQSICRVERGKVTNRLRFSIYERDCYQCQKCGRKASNLEIDHIIPISKGGKSEYHNLQTLCHHCNFEKSNKMDFSDLKNSQKESGFLHFCPWCGSKLQLKYGKYGRFLGCSRYPNCRFRSKL